MVILYMEIKVVSGVILFPCFPAISGVFLLSVEGIVFCIFIGD